MCFTILYWIKKVFIVVFIRQSLDINKDNYERFKQRVEIKMFS